MSGKDPNLLLRSSLKEDLSSFGVVNFFDLPNLGEFFTHEGFADVLRPIEFFWLMLF